MPETDTSDLSIHVLLVEDDESVREAMASVLEEDFTVTVASGGQEALDMLGKGLEFDAVCSDYSMPRVNGLDVLRAVKESFPSTVRILITGFRDEFRSNDQWRTLAQRVVLKPCEPDRLIELVRSTCLMRSMRNAATGAATAARALKTESTD